MLKVMGGGMTLFLARYLTLSLDARETPDIMGGTQYDFSPYNSFVPEYCSSSFHTAFLPYKFLSNWFYIA
jgi:hypothetical protein